MLRWKQQDCCVNGVAENSFEVGASLCRSPAALVIYRIVAWGSVCVLQICMAVTSDLEQQHLLHQNRKTLVRGTLDSVDPFQNTRFGFQMLNLSRVRIPKILHSTTGTVGAAVVGGLEVLYESSTESSFECNRKFRNPASTPYV
jgi:hypothetical protein